MIMDTTQSRTDDDNVLERDTSGFNLDDYVTFKFAILSQMFGRDAARIFSAKWGLSLPQYRILTVLGKLPGMSLRELTDRTQMDKGQLSRVVAQMENDGLITRESDSSDGRRLVLTLTRSGAKLYSQTTGTSEEHQKAILSVLTPQELDDLKVMLAKLTAHMRDRLAKD